MLQFQSLVRDHDSWSAEQMGEGNVVLMRGAADFGDAIVRDGEGIIDDRTISAEKIAAVMSPNGIVEQHPFKWGVILHTSEWRWRIHAGQIPLDMIDPADIGRRRACGSKSARTRELENSGKKHEKREYVFQHHINTLSARF